MQTHPALREVIAPLEADIKDDLEAVETILLSSRHQKRIADGKLGRWKEIKLLLSVPCRRCLAYLQDQR